MNSYLIQKRVRTPIQVFSALECKGFRILPVTGDLDGDFLSEKQIEAKNFQEAHQKFVADLLPIISAASIVTQCAVFSLLSSTCCIYRTNDNPDHVVLFYHVKETATAGMLLDEEELGDMQRILLRAQESPGDTAALTYLRQTNLASGPMVMLAMLVIAAEALAGKTTVTKKCECGRETSYPTTDRGALKSILGGQLFQKLYGKERLRHKLFHGGPVDETSIAEAAQDTYSQIFLRHLKDRYDLQTVEKIGEAPRSVYYEYAWVFLRLASVPNLLALEREWKNHEHIPEPSDY